MKNAQFNYKDIVTGKVIDGNISITCDKCGIENCFLYINSDIVSIQLDADYALHQFTCIKCRHLNMMLSFIDE